MKNLFKLILAGMLVSTPALAQTTAANVQPGQLKTAPQTNCTVGPCFVPFSSTNPLPVTPVSGGTAPNPLAVTPTNYSLSLTTGGTAQNILPVNSTRKGCTIQNPATAADQGISTAENIYVRFGGIAAPASDSFELTPGQSVSCNPTGEQVVTFAVSVVAATTSHKIIAIEYN